MTVKTEPPHAFDVYITVDTLIPLCAESAFWDRPRGSINSFSNIIPGCVATLFDGIILFLGRNVWLNQHLYSANLQDVEKTLASESGLPLFMGRIAVLLMMIVKKRGARVMESDPMQTTLLSTETDLQKKIYTFRDVQVMLDRDLAELYGVKTIRLREQVKRNSKRFPEDFMFQLSEKEVDLLLSQNAIPSRMPFS